MGQCLKKHPRESFYLATKFPGYDVSNMGKAREIFPEQLRRLQVEYIDYYLVHNVNEMDIDAYLDPKFGVLGYLLEEKKAGRIRHLGFSAHGSVETMRRFLEVYGSDMEFCQIQLNYVDWTLQDAKAKLGLLVEYHLPVWVMEPVRGGRLASLPEEGVKLLASLRPEEKPVAWAFRFLQSLPQVVVTLSGMSNMEQMQGNIQTFSEAKPLNEKEREALLSFAAHLMDGVLPWTGCRYCTAHCPKGLDIPQLLSLYNDWKFIGGGFVSAMVVTALPEDKRPTACIGCRSCEKLCPQGIKISEALADFRPEKLTF